MQNNILQQIEDPEFLLFTSAISPVQIDVHEGAKTARSRFNASITNSSPKAVRPVMGWRRFQPPRNNTNAAEYIEHLATF